MPAVPSLLQDTAIDTQDPTSTTRGDLFSMGTKVKTTQDAINFYVAVCSWDAGSKAQDIYRRVATLNEPEVEQKLLQGILLAKEARHGICLELEILFSGLLHRSFLQLCFGQQSMERSASFLKLA